MHLFIYFEVVDFSVLYFQELITFPVDSNKDGMFTNIILFSSQQFILSAIHFQTKLTIITHNNEITNKPYKTFVCNTYIYIDEDLHYLIFIDFQQPTKNIITYLLVNNNQTYQSIFQVDLLSHDKEDLRHMYRRTPATAIKKNITKINVIIIILELYFHFCFSILCNNNFVRCYNRISN